MSEVVFLDDPHTKGPVRSRWQFRIWHLALLNLLVAVAIVNIKDQHRDEPELVTLAAIGFVAYGALAVIGWNLSRRFEATWGPVARFAVYAVAMGALFLVATLIYVNLETVYLAGGFWTLLRSRLEDFGLFAAGIITYGILAVFLWKATKRLDHRPGRLTRITVFVAAMTGVFVVETVIAAGFDLDFSFGGLWPEVHRGFALFWSSLRA